MNIKLKLWNPHAKKFHYDVENVYDCLKAQKVFEGVESRGFTLPYNYVEEGFEWLLFAGLKGKNNVEYCEGDIVKDGTLNEQIGVVKFKDGCFILEFQDCSYYLLKHYENVGEIIGNIYESPELLTKNEE